MTLLASAKLAKRVLLETDKRLLWKLAYNMGFKGALSVHRHKLCLESVRVGMLEEMLQHFVEHNYDTGRIARKCARIVPSCTSLMNWKAGPDSCSHGLAVAGDQPADRVAISQAPSMGASPTTDSSDRSNFPVMRIIESAITTTASSDDC